MSNILRVGHWQLACAAGDYQANIAKVLRGLDRADAERMDIVSFPESFLTGYFDRERPARQHSWRVGEGIFSEFLAQTARFRATIIVGFNETRGSDLHISALVARRGQLLGVYRKAFPCAEHETPGRDFPIFEANGVKFGVILCADGGYIEPSRLLALGGARIIFAPHYNYISPEHLIAHYQHVRNDHIARAVENDVWFFRGNSVSFGADAGLSYAGIGCGDSYLIDPAGEIVVRGQRHTECFIGAEIELMPAGFNRSLIGAGALGPRVLEMARDKGAIEQ